MDWLTDALVDAAEAILGILPDSPFKFLATMDNSQFYQWMKWLNWFIPVQQIMTILSAWCGAILFYYIFQIVLRWTKTIE